MRPILIHGARSGVVLGIVVLFLILVGFTGVVAELLADGVFDAVDEEQALILGLLTLLGCLALWSGWRGAPRRAPDSWSYAVLGGASAGAAMGITLGVIVIVLGWLESSGIDIRKYFVQLSPQAIELLRLGTTVAAAAAIYVVGGAAAGALGGALARGVGRGAWRAGAAERLAAVRQRAADSAPVQLLSTDVRARRTVQLLALALVLLLPLVLDKYWNFTLGTVGIYVLMALGLNIVVGLAGLLDLGYVAFFAVGAYVMALFTAPKPHGLVWDFWLVLPLAVAFAALAGILLGIPVLRLRGDYLAIVTLGFGEIIRVLVKSEVLKGVTGGPQGVRDIGGPAIMGQSLISERDYLYLIVFAILLVIFVTMRLERSKVGRSWIAMREDGTVAQAVGISVYRSKLLAFAIGAAFAGLGGALFAARNQYTGPDDHNLMVSINVLCMVVVGGMGSIPGAIVGAFVLKGLPEVLRELDEYRMLAFGALLVTMMIWRPQGLWPSRRRRLEMPPADSGSAPPPGKPDADRVADNTLTPGADSVQP